MIRIKSIIIPVLVACVLATGMILTSGTTQQQSVITVKPATPKYTIVKAFRNYYNVQDDVAAYILENVRKGYITKSVSCFEEDGIQRAVVVMEKY